MAFCLADRVFGLSPGSQDNHPIEHKKPNTKKNNILLCFFLHPVSLYNQEENKTSNIPEHLREFWTGVYIFALSVSFLHLAAFKIKKSNLYVVKTKAYQLHILTSKKNE